MPNTETDKLGLVETTTVKGGSWIFPRRVEVNTGFSLQVFRASGQYYGTVDEHGGHRIRAHDGDLVLRISLGEFPLAFSGGLPTRDGHTRPYDAEIILRVSDPEQFAISYRQQTDPVARARKTIDANLVNWSSGLLHDEITLGSLRYRVEHALLAVSRTIGLTVVSADKVIAYVSATRAAIIEKRNQDEVDVFEHTITIRKNEEQRIEEGKNREAERQQSLLDKDAELIMQRREDTFRTIQRNYQKRLDDLLRDGYTLEDINRDYPDLMPTLARLGGAQGEDLRMLTNGESGITDPGNPSADPFRRLPRAYDEGVRIDTLGIMVVPAQLTINQQQLVSAQQIEVEQAFQILKLDNGGPATFANLEIGDILLQANGQAIDDIEALSLLLAPTTGIRMQARITILRDMQVSVFNVDVAV